MERKVIIMALLCMLFAGSLEIACTAGKYDSGGSCYICPKGYICSGVDPAVMVPCPLGTYSDFGASVCIDCPAGFKCPTPKSIPIACVFGEYTDLGQKECRTCPPGSFCATPATRTDCPRGAGNNHYCLGGTANKRKCPAGFMCPTSTGAPVACAVGTYAPEGSDACLPCPAGKFCPNPSMNAENCPAGYFSLGGATSCTICPADHGCTFTTVPVACPLGYYAPAGYAACIECPAGYYCDRVAHPGVATACSSGKMAAAGSTQCIDCQPGYQCPHGLPIACPAGFYSADGTACTECTVGSACPVGVIAPIACPDGTYAGKAATTCTVCTVGHYCISTGYNFEMPCPKGMYQDLTGQLSCTSCSGATGCSSDATTTAPTYCTAGQYFNGLFNCYVYFFVSNCR